MEAQGRKQDALNAIRADAIRGLTDEAIAVYDANRALEEQIRVQRSLNELSRDGRKLQAELLELQGDAAGAKAILRELAIEGLTEVEIAAYDANQALRDHIAALREQARVAEERANLENRLYQLLGDQDAISAREREKLDPSNRSLFDSIVALERAKAAAEAALDTLANAVRAEQQRLRDQFEREADILRDRISAISGVVRTLNSALESSREKLRSDSIASQTAARLTLQSIVTAVRGGADISSFGDVIGQALGALNVNDPNLYASREEFLRNQAITADTIMELAELGGDQLDVAERQLVALEDGFKAEIARLDGIIETAKQQINAILDVKTGVDSVNASVLSVRDALQAFNASISQLSSARSAASAAVSSGSASSAQTSVTGSSQTSGTYGYYMMSDGKTAILFAPGGATYTAKGPNAEQILIDTYGLVQTPSGLYIRTRAHGGLTPPGLTLVGEHGPELVNFRNPAMVYSSRQTAEILGNKEVVDELKALRAEVIEMRIQARRTADAVNGAPESPMLVEAVA
ncbi:MAG: hypothetical protein N2690_05825 [Rhodocyclaceae bacterium]|nr:hypothetical protein [Rhodocyclaceae bacterium]